MPGGAATDPARRLDLLLSPAGQRLLAELRAAPVDTQSELHLSNQLRKTYEAELVNAALALRQLRVRARKKFSRAERLYLSRAGLEQASGEAAARHHAARLAAFSRVGDLCCGIGGDLMALAAAPRSISAFDLDPTHLRMAGENVAACDGVAEVDYVHADVASADLSGLDAVFVDPARRGAERRFAPGVSQPTLDWCFRLTSQIPAVGIKAAPGLPREVAPHGWELEFVADGRELKEALLWSPAVATSARRATVLPTYASLVGGSGLPVDVAPPGGFLVDPSPAVTRAGLVEDLARSIGAWKIDAQVAFLALDRAVTTEFGRTLLVDASLPWNLKNLRAELRRLDVGSVGIRKRGSAVDVDDLQRRLRLDGSRAATVVLTRVADRPWAFVCRDVG